jgi:hypothetical protein
MNGRPVNRSDEELRMRALAEAQMRKLWPDARIVHEFPLRYSTNRIDLAAITPEKIVGVELKSSRDATLRLEAQIRAFLPVCARVVVALAPKWNAQLPTAAVRSKGGIVSMIPTYTEAQQIIQRCGGATETWTIDADRELIDVTASRYRDDAPHPRRLLDLLHVAELVEIADRRRVSRAVRPVHFDLAEACFDMMSAREVKFDVCRALRARVGFGSGSDAPILVEPR